MIAVIAASTPDTVVARWILFNVAPLVLGIAALLGYIYVAGCVWRGLRATWRALEEPLDLDETLQWFFIPVCVVVWPLFLTGKYLVLGAIGLWRIGLLRLLRALAWPIAAVWRAGAGSAPEKVALPNARVVRRRAKDEEINAGNFEQGCP